MLKPGKTAEVTFSVTEALTAKTMGSGTLDVLATPAMIAHMERAAWTAVSEDIPPDSATVGIRMEVSHTSATPVGMSVTCRAELLEVQGRTLVFHVSAFDGKGVIGEGTHERVVVQVDRFLEKVGKKRENGGKSGGFSAEE